MKKHLPIILILIAVSFLLFLNLSNQYLWQDEAETAQLAKNTLKFGFPTAYDGKNLVNPVIRTGYGPNYGWRYHPWGQFYLTAGSFLLFGINTFAARFPFALLGVINVLLIYILSVKLTKERTVAILASLLLSTSVPYLLLMRQCRYYAPATFLILLILLLYRKFLEKRSGKYIAMFSAVLVMLTYTVHGMLLPIFAAIGLHFLIFAFDKRSFPRMILAGVIVAAASAPWFIYSNTGAHVADISIARLWKNLEFQIRMINKYIFPAFFFICAYAVRLVWKRNWKISLSPEEKKTLSIIVSVVLMSLVAFCFAEERNFRYLVFFIPLFALIQGMILLRLYRFNRYLLGAFLVLSVFTGIFNMGTPSFYFPRYLYEITHDYDGPIEGIVRFLNKNSKEGDTVKIIYGDLPLMFYTGLEVDNSQVYDDEHMPEWIVFRRGWHERLDNKYYTKVGDTYKKHILDYPDIKWENRPGDLTYHRFSTDKEAPGVVIFEKK